jgi:predicted membrane-bound spermidine synthase
MLDRRWFSPALLGLFVLSGFAGLIYQSIWSHYLGLTLGHAAYAQTLVLAMFMGGMALGAWLVSRYAHRLKRLILGYAVIEGVIGLMGLVFHPLFLAYTGVSQESALPLFGGWGLAWLWQWGSAAALIAPQTILLGATFPLMSAGLMRARLGEDGEVLGGLYFTNSIGAALGVLAATFVLLPSIGMPGAMALAGGLNLLVAVLAWALARGLREETLPPLPAPAAATEAGGHATPELAHLYRVLLGATFLSSAASFVYEIGWVRLLNQALGTTLHSFELMLATFIAGLAFGGLWVRKRAKAVKDVVQYAGFVQVLMGVAALVSVPLLSSSFEWVGWTMRALARTEEGYTLYTLATAGIAMLIMFPAAFFAGMTLPLFTSALLRKGSGEAAIGRVYAANTLGAIVGVMLAVHVLIPIIGIRLTVTTAALVDALIGLYLLRAVSPGVWMPRVAVAGVATLAFFAASVQFGQLDPREQMAGVFRTGNVSVPESAEVTFLRDGSTATIGVMVQGSLKTISTNGKPDASLTPLGEPPTLDEITMLMAAALPLATHPAPERVAIIGWGSGLTTHTMLGSSVPKVVDNIEIEHAMWEGAKFFAERVDRAYLDPRSKVHFDDARTFFAAGGRRYDVIISEPSNPWVSGVASLFTEEFYRFLHGHLEDDGQLVQWIQSYEIDDPMVATMVSALLEVFPQSELYVTNTADLLILARKTPGAGYLPEPWATEPLASELRRVGLGSPADLAIRRVGGPSVLRTLVRLYDAPPHSDFYPTVSLRGPETRFRNASSMILQRLVWSGLPVLDALECRRPPAEAAGVLPTDNSTAVRDLWRADAIAEAMAGRGTGTFAQEEGVMPPLFAYLSTAPQADSEARETSRILASIASHSIGILAAERIGPLWAEAAWIEPGRAALPGVAAQRAVLAAAAARDWPALGREAEALLGGEDFAGLHPGAREQVLVLAMVAALAEGRSEAVAELEAEYGPRVGVAALGDLRGFLMAFADGETACAFTAAGSPAPARPAG